MPGYKHQVKTHCGIGKETIIQKGDFEYTGIVEINSFIASDHGPVESDSVVVLRDDRAKMKYVIPMGSQVDGVLIIPFKPEK
jgi:hypothetical protein